MSEVFFYHLQRQSLEAVLPTLLTRSLERGWHAIVRLGSEARLAALDDHLWSFSGESFLAHGSDREPEPEGQPILLTLGEANPNGAAILFVADGAALPEDLSAYERVALMFDGADPEAVEAARATWRGLRERGHEIAYWQQDEAGRWSKKA